LSIKALGDRASKDDVAPFLMLDQSPLVERRYPWRRLSLLIVLISASAVAGLLVFKASISVTPSAVMLLDQASVAELAAHSSSDRVRHRVFNLEERRSVEGAVVSQRKIEIW
jgi:hypothetical protein